jgi:hypothetical protein
MGEKAESRTREPADRPQPFPRPGERLAGPSAPSHAKHGATRSTRPISIFGGVCYAPGNPSRWAGAQGSGTTRLTVEEDAILLTPLWIWRLVNRLPVVRIPIDKVEAASRTTFGLTFVVPSDPDLDGTRFVPFGGDRDALRPLVELLERRGIPIDTMPVANRIRGYLRDHAVASRPGWIWRDRGRLGFLESTVGLAIGLAVFYFLGFFSKAPVFFLVAIGVVEALNVWGWVAGYRRRRKVVAARRDGER